MPEPIEGEELDDGRVRVVSYASFDALMEDQRQAEAEANARAHEDQLAITWGDYAIGHTDDPTVVVFGLIVDEKEHIDYETELAETTLEKMHIERRIRDVFARGYRFGRWFSKVCPEGEWGTKHVATLWKITKEEFQAAGNNGWIAPDAIRAQINERIAATLPDDPRVQAHLARERAIEETLMSSAAILLDEMEATNEAPNEEFMRGVVELGMYLTETDPSESEHWIAELRKDMVKLSLMFKEANEGQQQN